MKEKTAIQKAWAMRKLIEMQRVMLGHFKKKLENAPTDEEKMQVAGEILNWAKRFEDE